MSDEQEDPREHIDDWEWLYQHGYLDGTLYAERRRVIEAAQTLTHILQTEIRRHWVTRIIFAPWFLAGRLLERLGR